MGDICRYIYIHIYICMCVCGYIEGTYCTYEFGVWRLGAFNAWTDLVLLPFYIPQDSKE